MPLPVRLLMEYWHGLTAGLAVAGILLTGTEVGTVCALLAAVTLAYGLGMLSVVRTALEMNQALKDENKHLRAHLRREHNVRARMIARSRERAERRRGRGTGA